MILSVLRHTATRRLPESGCTGTSARFDFAGWMILLEVLALVGYFLFTPGLIAAERRRLAASVVDDIEQVQAAAVAAHALVGKWPSDGAPGRVPESLEPFLSPDFVFDRKVYALDWDQWHLSDSPDTPARTRELLAVSVVAGDPGLSGLVVEALGSRLEHFTVGDRTTFVIPGSEDFAAMTSHELGFKLTHRAGRASGGIPVGDLHDSLPGRASAPR